MLAKDHCENLSLIEPTCKMDFGSVIPMRSEKDMLVSVERAITFVPYFTTTCTRLSICLNSSDTCAKLASVGWAQRCEPAKHLSAGTIVLVGSALARLSPP